MKSESRRPRPARAWHRADRRRRSRRYSLPDQATRSIAIAVASPPPMHSAATPFFRPCFSSACKRVTTIRAPDAPIGWPSAQAPPLMLTLSCGRSMVAHRRHGDDGEGLVDLPELDVLGRPAGPLQHLADRADRRGGEQVRVLRVRRMRPDDRQRSDALLLRLRTPHQNQCRGAIGNRAGGRGSHRAVLAERRLQCRDLFDVDRERRLVLADGAIALAILDGDRRDLLFERTVVGRLLRAGDRGCGELILRLARELVHLRAFFGERPHRPAFLVRILEAVVEHVVHQLVAMAEAIAGAALQHQVRRVGHALHAAGDDDVVRAGEQVIMTEHGRLHRRAAHLRQRRRPGTATAPRRNEPPGGQAPASSPPSSSSP